jgi:S1-C subfamily serine protease
MVLRTIRFLLTGAAALLGAACEAPERPFASQSEPTVTFIPAPRAQPPAPQSPAGFVERLGVSVRAGPNGLVIVAIDLDGPAAQAGTEVGDVVIGVNGALPADLPELQQLVKAAPQGVELQLRRRGEPRQVAIRLPDPGQASASAGAWTALGLQVKDLPDAARKALGVTQGVMVTKVRAPADRTRILPGDVIVAVDRQNVGSAEEFMRIAERAAGRNAAAVGLLVKRADSDLFIALEPADAGAQGLGEASRGGGAPRLEDRYRRRPPTGTPLRT